MRPLVHWTVAWTACFAVTFALLAAATFVRGDLAAHWQSVPGAFQGIGVILVLSIVSGAAIAGIGAFFDWLGWGRDPEGERIKNPIVRAVLLPVILFAAASIWWSLGGR